MNIKIILLIIKLRSQKIALEMLGLKGKSLLSRLSNKRDDGSIHMVKEYSTVGEVARN